VIFWLQQTTHFTMQKKGKGNWNWGNGEGEEWALSVDKKGCRYTKRGEGKDCFWFWC